MVRSKLRWLSGAAVGALCMSMTLVGMSVTAQAAKKKVYHVAYLSYAVANSYDAPMLAAAKAVAAADGVQVTVFDANNTPATQVAQLQDVISSGNYQGVLLQPIYGPAEIKYVRQVIAHKIKVVNIDQILGTKYTTDQIQVKGLSGNVVFFPSKIGTQLAALVVKACGAINPCKVGLVHNFKGYEPDVAISDAFSAHLASHSNIQVVDQVDGLYQVGASTTQVQNMLQANPGINIIVGSDQNCEGAQIALGPKPTAKLVCYGASAASVAGLKSRLWYADVAQMPATEGQVGMEMLIRAMKTGKPQGSKNPVAGLANGGVITVANLKNFTPEWPG